MKTLCLNMIVKNESKIITRALESVKDHIDYYVISDTGSTDNTKELITEYFKTHNIKGEIHDHKWKNFCHNRTLALKAAQGKTDYILLMDADMIFKVKDKNFKEHLSNDVNLLLQGQSFVYYNIRIIISTLNCEYKGVTHEYLDIMENNYKRGNFDEVYFHDYGDGGNRHEKYTRDIKLLTDGLKEEPNNERYMFYLAQSYKDTQQFENAIQWYMKRIERKGWIEEVWYSYYMIGKCFELLGNSYCAMYYFLQAYDYYPERAESLYDVIKHYREKENYRLARMYLETAKLVKFPEHSTLFIESSIYNYKFAYEESIIGFYENKNLDGYLASDYIKLKKNLNVDHHLYELTKANTFFYIKPLSDYLKYSFDITEIKLKNPVHKHYVCNTSIINDIDKYILNVREVSYYFNIETNRYHYDKTIDTYNHLINIDEITDNEMESNVITEKSNIIQYYENDVTGFEDMRLIKHNGELWSVCTCRKTNPTGMNEIVICKIDNNTITKVLRLKGFEEGRCEKNWVPFIHEDSICILYMSDPMTVIRPNLETGEYEILCRKESNYFNYSDFRGGSQLIPYKNGYLYIIHEVIFRNSRRYYFHRFVYIENFEVVEFSPMFYLVNKTIEFVAGLCYSKDKQNIIITLGLEDKKAYIYTMSVNDIDGLLCMKNKLSYYK